MTQLILDTKGHNIVLPESIKSGYKAEEVPLSVEIQMISGRTTRELNGHLWQVKYQYGYFDNETKNKVLDACKKGQRQPISCGFLTPYSGGELTYSDFFVTSFTYPDFMWSSTGKDGYNIPLWANFAVELREVRPHD